MIAVKLLYVMFVISVWSVVSFCLNWRILVELVRNLVAHGDAGRGSEG